MVVKQKQILSITYPTAGTQIFIIFALMCVVAVGFTLAYTIQIGKEVETQEETARDKMRKIVKELLQNRTDSPDMVRNGNYSDVNRNNVPDLEELDDVVLSNKTSEIIEILNTKDPEEIAIVLNEILIKVDTRNLPQDYKNLFKKNV